MAPLAPLPHQALMGFDVSIGFRHAGEVRGTATRGCSAVRVDSDPRLFLCIPLGRGDVDGFEVSLRQLGELGKGQQFFHGFLLGKANWSCEP